MDTVASRQIIVDRARERLGVKFKHMGRSDKIGYDCIGLVLDALPHKYFPDWVYTWPYKRVDKTGKLFEVLHKHCHVVTGEMEPGDIWAWSHKNGQQHCGIQTEQKGWIVHAVWRPGRVVESPIPGEYKHFLTGRFRVKWVN